MYGVNALSRRPEGILRFNPDSEQVLVSVDGETVSFYVSLDGHVGLFGLYVGHQSLPCGECFGS